MWILKLAWKNMWRNPLRTAIITASVFFAVILSVLTSSLKSGIFDNLVNNLVGYYSGYIQVHSNGYWDEQILENAFNASRISKIKLLNDKRITAVSARIESFALSSADSKTKGCLVIGVEPQTENNISSLASRVIEGDYGAITRGSVMVSEGLMRQLQLNVNDTLVLIGQGYHGATAVGKYKIGAKLKFGAPNLNETTVFMSLADAQSFFAAEEMITSLVFSLRDRTKMNAIRSSLQANLGDQYEVMTWEQMMPDVSQHIKGDSANMQIVHFILYILISFGIFSTLLVMMAERAHEMGMLVAIGMKKSFLSVVLLIESVLTVIGGCILGILASIPIVYYLNKNPIQMGGELAKAYERFGFEAIFPTSLDPNHFIDQGIIVICIGLFLSLYPVYVVLRLNPVFAMKKR